MCKNPRRQRLFGSFCNVFDNGAIINFEKIKSKGRTRFPAGTSPLLSACKGRRCGLYRCNYNTYFLHRHPFFSDNISVIGIFMSFEKIHNLFFGAEIAWYACLVRIFLSFAAGAVLGFERKLRQQFVGMRTLILISVSSTLLMLLSIYAASLSENPARGDPSRIAAQVVSGIGFLGAGTILREGLNIKGLTSSAIIWSAAALGLAIGAGFVFPAFATLLFYVFALIYLEKVEEKYFPAERAKHLNLVFENKRIDLDALTKLICANGLIIMSTDITRILGQKHLSIAFSVRVPPSLDIFSLTDKIKQIGRLEEFSLTD